MPEKPTDAELTRAASDPTTSQAMLADLAYDHPELRGAIAKNPSTYEGLLQWLGELPDADIQAALAERAATSATQDKSSTASTISEPPKAAPAAVEPAVADAPTVVVPSAAAQAKTATPPDLEKCRHCSAPLRATANYCGNCGIFVPGRVPYSTIGNLTPQANRAIFATSLAVLGVVVIVAVVFAAAGTVSGIQYAVNTSASAADQNSNGDSDSSGPSADPSPSDEPTVKPTPELPPLGQGFIADDPSLYSGLGGFGDDIDLRSPSGNIHCAIDLPTNQNGSGAGCYLDHYTYTPPQPNPCNSTDGSGAAYGGMWDVDAAGSAKAVCYQGVQWGAGDNETPVLPYGHTLTYGGYIVISESTGMSLINVSTRHGVKLNLTSWATF